MKKIKLFKRLLLQVIFILFTFTFVNKLIVKAHIPLNPEFYGYGLMPYETSNVSLTSKEVTFDLRNDNLGRYKVIEQYKINVNENKTIKVALPVIDNYGKVELLHNDKVISPQIYYGRGLASFFDWDKEKVINDINIDEEIKNVYPDDYRYDDNLKGHFYTIKNSNDVTVDLTNQKVLYSLKDSAELTGKTLKITSTNQEFSYFVIGAEVTPVTTGDYTKEEITYNDYFDRAFTKIDRKIENPGIFAAKFYKFLESDNQTIYFQFFDGLEHNNLRLYVFELPLVGGKTNDINVTYPIRAASNQNYDPTKWIFNYQSHNDKWTSIIDYEVKVNTSEKNPYLIDTNIKFEKNKDNEYQSDVKTEELSLTVCRSKHPVRFLLWDGFGYSALGQYFIVGLILLIILIFLIFIILGIIKLVKRIKMNN